MKLFTLIIFLIFNTVAYSSLTSFQSNNIIDAVELNSNFQYIKTLSGSNVNLNIFQNNNLIKKEDIQENINLLSQGTSLSLTLSSSNIIATEINTIFTALESEFAPSGTIIEYDNSASNYGISSIYGQSFTATADGNITKAAFKLGNPSSSGSGTFRYELYEFSSNLPTGYPVPVAQTLDYNVSILPDSSGLSAPFLELDFITPYSVINGNQYILVLNYSNGGVNMGVTSNSNGNIYTGGSLYLGINPTTWILVSPDAAFRIVIE